MKLPALFVLLSLLACGGSDPEWAPGHFPMPESKVEFRSGAAVFLDDLTDWKDKRVGLVVNQTATVGSSHLLDTLLARGITVQKVFAPEHGFRGDHADGSKITDGKDEATGVPLVSIYGRNKKPTPAMLADLDLLVFDIQDVGVRCYTFISTMHLCMEAATEADIPFVVLDRPNPNGFYVAGPVLDKRFTSFVGKHPIPLVHGLTVGELALMIQGEGWMELPDSTAVLDLEVVACEGYAHSHRYTLPVAPSPNLPNMRSVYLYPALVLMEATDCSVGRGTDMPFQRFGFPDNPEGDVAFVPQRIPGVSDHPKHEGLTCRGWDPTDEELDEMHRSGRLYWDWLLRAYKSYPEPEQFFVRSDFFDRLAGTRALRAGIEAGFTEAQVRATWQTDLESYLRMRKGYLLYPDFE